MTDDKTLVERLRALARAEHDDLSVGDEAADRIEALEAELASSEALTQTWREHAKLPELVAESVPLLGEAVKKLEAENERLRAALTRQCDNIAFILNHATVDGWYKKFCEELVADRAALAPTKEG